MIRAGIIGLGVGEQHIAGYEQHPDCKVVALCDIDPAKEHLARQKYPQIPFMRDARAVLEDPGIHVVSIASYDDVHFEQVCAALEHGKHIFVEKPLCLRKDHAKYIRSLLIRNPGLKLSSNLILRKCPRFMWLREQVHAGTLGNIYSVEADYLYGRMTKLTEGWRGRLAEYSVFLGGGVHMVDLINWLVPGRVLRVHGGGNKIASAGQPNPNDDFMVALLQYADGRWAKVSANFSCVHPHFHRLSLFGTRATFQNGLDCGWLFESRDQAVPPQRIELPYPGYQKGDLIHSFLEDIMGTGHAEVGVEDVFNTMSVCLAVEQSRQSGKVEEVEYI